MRRFIYMLVASAFALGASAQSIDKITTRDGSEYWGYISEQIPGKHVYVRAEYAHIVFNAKEIKNKRIDFFDYDRLSDEAKKDARYVCDTVNFRLSSFEYRGEYYENLLICSPADHADSTVRAYALTPRSYLIPWSELSKTTRVARNEQPHGIKDAVILKSGERYDGQIVEQVVASSVTMTLEDGTRREISNSDILSIKSEAISDKYTIWEQLPLLDRLVYDNGRDEEGFISSRLMGQYVNFIKKEGYDNEPVQIQMKHIAAFQKTPNPDYMEFVPDTVQVRKLEDENVETLALELDEECYPIKDTLFRGFERENGKTVLKLAIKNVEHQKTAALYAYRTVYFKKEAKDFCRRIFTKKENRKLGIWDDDTPVYETTYVENGDYSVCEIIVRKPGKYFLSINGFEEGINIEVWE